MNTRGKRTFSHDSIRSTFFTFRSPSIPHGSSTTPNTYTHSLHIIHTPEEIHTAQGGMTNPVNLVRPLPKSPQASPQASSSLTRRGAQFQSRT